jgi:uncharacterized protein (AIM24 family)
MKLSKKKFFSLLAITVLAVTAFAPAAMAVYNIGSRSDIQADIEDGSGDNWEYNATDSILTVKNNITITGSGDGIADKIILKIAAEKTVTWEAKGEVTEASKGDLITIEGGETSKFIVALGTESLLNNHSVLVNESSAQIEIKSGTLKSTSTTGGFITLYSKGDVTIDSSAADVTIESASGNAVHVKDADISIAGDSTKQLTIKTEAEGFAAIYIEGAGKVIVTGNNGGVAKTLITASAGNSAAIYNEKGDVTVTDATIEVDSADSAGVYAQEGNVIIKGATVINVSDGEDCVGVYAKKGKVTIEGDAVIKADDKGGVAVYSENGDVTLDNNANLSADKGGPVVEARKGNVTVAAPGVTVNAGSAAGVAIRASGTITTDGGATVTGTEKPNYNYNPPASPGSSSSSGCDAGFGGLFGILALAGTALIRGKR